MPRPCCSAGKFLPRSLPVLLAIPLFWLLLMVTPPAAAETLSHGRFKTVQVYRPVGEVKHVVLFLSGDGGWTRGLAGMASHMVADGSMVIGIDTPELFEELEKDGGSCVFPDGDLENLSHWVQAYYKLPTYYTPLLVGYSSGATLAYAMVAQAPPGLFAGAISLSFCQDLDLKKPLCKVANLRYTMRKDGEGARLIPSKVRVPWIALHGTEDQVCPAAEAREFVKHSEPAQFVELPQVGHNYTRQTRWLPQFRAAYSTILSEQTQPLPMPPKSLEDIPIVEVPVEGTAKSDVFAILISGDGGWAGIDKEVAAALSQRGVPVAGIDSLRYFWAERTPDGLAQDVDRMLRYYAYHWDKKRALLIGYSQGADVLPFAVNRLPNATRSLVALTALIGISQSADFEFHVTNWLGGSEEGLPTRPETDKLSAEDTLCLYGSDDSDSLCPTIGKEHARVVPLSGGHHFGGEYQHVADLLVQQAGLH